MTRVHALVKWKLTKAKLYDDVPSKFGSAIAPAKKIKLDLGYFTRLVVS